VLFRSNLDVAGTLPPPYTGPVGGAQDGGPEGAGSVHAQAAGLLSVGEASRLFGVPRATLSVAAREGRLDARKVGKGYVTTAAAVRAWLRDARHRPGPRPGKGVGRPRRPGAGSPPADRGAPGA
jgi:excisionase family DNA binding protein